MKKEKVFEMKLTNKDKKMLDGDEGPAKQKAMELIVRYGEVIGAEALCSVTWADLFCGSHAYLDVLGAGDFDEVFSRMSLCATEPVPLEQENIALAPKEASQEDVSSFVEASPTQEGETEIRPVTLEDLRQRYPTNLRRAEHRRDLALTLFDGTKPIHRLPDEYRKLLEVAARVARIAPTLKGLKIIEAFPQLAKGRCQLVVIRPNVFHRCRSGWYPRRLREVLDPLIQRGC